MRGIAHLRCLSVYDDYHNGHDAYYADTAGYHPPWTPGMSRRRRHSSMGMSMRSRSHYGDSYRRMSNVLIKLRRKGGYRNGVSLGEAMANVRLSGNDDYTFQDLNVDSRGRIILKIRVRTQRSCDMSVSLAGC